MLRRVINATFMVACVAVQVFAQLRTKTESFDEDPGWEGINNRSAHTRPPMTVRQDFGYSRTSHAGGEAGEIGGFITPAAETAYYATPVPTATFNDKLSASGTLACPDGAFHLLLGFFNAKTVNEWRTPNTLALRLNGRGQFFYAYPEFLTSKWRIGALDDPRSKGFGILNQRGRETMHEFPSGGAVLKWSITYDPNGNDGKPILSATIGDQTSVSFPDPKYIADGATFNRFGILNIMKSADTGGEIYIDNLVLNGQRQTFDQDPKWEGRNNRATYESRDLRFYFDFGFSPTHFAGGKSKGELGGVIFRGDCRAAQTMAAYGDRVGPLTLDKPFKASGKLAFTRGVTDSGGMIGFFHSKHSMEVSNRQDSGAPKCLIEMVIEGPSMEGFFVYPSYRMNGDLEGQNARDPNPLRIYPDGKPHDWSLEYEPAAAEGRGRITVTLDGRSVHCDLREGHKDPNTTFDRFGIVTSWIDGNSVNAYFDDITYTVSQ